MRRPAAKPAAPTDAGATTGMEAVDPRDQVPEVEVAAEPVVVAEEVVVVEEEVVVAERAVGSATPTGRKWISF